MKTNRKFLGIIMVLVVIVAVFVGVNNGSLQSLNTQKLTLIETLFGQQLAQIKLVSEQLSQQIEAYQHEDEKLSADKIEQSRKLIAQTEEKMLKTVKDILAQTYSLEELKEKQAFENSDLSRALSAKEDEIVKLMHFAGKELGREAILKSVDREFDEKQSQTLRKIVKQLTLDDEMTNQDRVTLITRELDMAEQQATMMLTLLSISHADAIDNVEMARLDHENTPQKKLELARKYVNITHLDNVFGQTVATMAKEADIEKNYAYAQNKMVVGVAHIYDEQTLEKANEYFTKDIARRVLKKDVQVIQEISPRIQQYMQKLDEKIAQIIQGA